MCGADDGGVGVDDLYTESANWVAGRLEAERGVDPLSSQGEDLTEEVLAVLGALKEGEFAVWGEQFAAQVQALASEFCPDWTVAVSFVPEVPARPTGGDLSGLARMLWAESVARVPLPGTDVLPELYGYERPVAPLIREGCWPHLRVPAYARHGLVGWSGVTSAPVR